MEEVERVTSVEAHDNTFYNVRYVYSYVSSNTRAVEAKAAPLSPTPSHAL